MSREVEVPSASAPIDETKRLDVVASLGLGGAQGVDFSDIVTLAGDLGEAPIALVTIVEQDRQVFHAAIGLDGPGTPRSQSFCAHAILDDQVLWVEDARQDPRFADNPLVTGEPRIRLYAGAPIVVDGHGVGSVCVIDRSPRALDPVLAKRLSGLAAIAARRLINRRELLRLKALKEQSPDAIVTFDGDGIVCGWNPAAASLFGRSATDMLGQSGDLIIPEADRAFRQSELRRMAAGQAPVFKGRVERVRGLRVDGSEISLEASYSLHRLGSFFRLSAILRDCTEREARQAELTKALEAAQAGERAKSAFLANMSHEIRTPLNAIVGLAQVIAQDPKATEVGHHAETIRRSGLALKGLLDDVLEASRLGEPDAARAEPIDLLALGSSLIDLYGPAASAKGVGVAFIKQGSCPTTVLGDATRLRQVLGNLLSNAVKFTEHGQIHLVLSPGQGDDLIFEVRDTGIGFSKAIAARLFERFFQGDESIRRRFGGAGLGLSICRELVLAMGGEIVADGRPGRGATFSVRLPLPAADPRVPSGPLPDVADGEPQDDAPCLEGLQALVVDDNAVNRQVLSIMLLGLGAGVAFAENGQEALEVSDSRPFGIILMDIHMPVLDGLEATRRLRARELADGTAQTPVIMVSADDGAECIDAGRKAGAQAHIGKPITPSALLSAIVSALS